MTKYVRPKGTFDILPELYDIEDVWKESSRWHYLESTMCALAREYAYQEIRTPIFEQTELFVREVGETSDIVSKEMYTFLDRGGRSMSLRPEGTAGVIRAFVQGDLQHLGTIHKFFYIGPFFRYDRPQAGRYRQLHQFGVEAIGNRDPEQDFEVIALLHELYRRLGLKDLTLLINTLGDPSSRAKYKEALLTYLRPHFSSLSKDSQKRFTTNPLRILDSKDSSERVLLENAPSITDFLSPESKAHFSALCALLTEQKIPFTIDPKLVRGLDYYNYTVFEIVSELLGAQNTVGAGGRYDGLPSSLGGSDLPCVGFSTGMERILHLMEKQNATCPPKTGPFVTMISLGEKGKKMAFDFLYELRRNHIPSDMIVVKKIYKGLQLAERIHSTFSVIIGERELAQGCAHLKAMQTRKTQKVNFATLVTYLKKEFCHGLQKNA